MDGSSAKKSTSFETLVIQNISNVNDLKAKLSEIISAGNNYEYDVSSCLKSLLKSSDKEIVLLAVQAVSELAKCEEKRETYASKEIIEPILNNLRKELSSDTIELVKHCCRALGNLCCDCDAARTIILDSDGVPALIKLLEKTLDQKMKPFEEVKLIACKSLLNYAIGGQQFTESIVQGGLISLLHKILVSELNKEDMNDDMVSTALLILSVMLENTPEFLFEPEVNTTVLNVLRETSNVEISEQCLEHFHYQAEHDSVKTLLAKEKGVQLVCQRLELFVQQHESGQLSSEDAEVEAVLKQACDLIIIVLTGDEAMHILYDNGRGEVYTTMVKWLDASNQHLLTTAILAIGNFARKDDYCIKMMNDKIYDRLLDIFEIYHNHGLTIKNFPEANHSVNQSTVTKIQHAVLSALRNLTVVAENKRVVASKGRATPLLLNALPTVEDHHVAYKLLAAIRMLVNGQASKGHATPLLLNALPTVEDHHVAYKLLAAIRMLVNGQEEVAKQLLEHSSALAATARWAGAGGGGGAAGEAPRLLAWAVRGGAGGSNIVQVDGCVSSLVSMLVVCHSVMQDEAILALTLLAIEALKETNNTSFDTKTAFITQLIKSEIGKHLSVLIETNCAKMPIENATNLLTFLNTTVKEKLIAKDLKEANVQESLQKFMESRKDLDFDQKEDIKKVIKKLKEVEEAMDQNSA